MTIIINFRRLPLANAAVGSLLDISNEISSWKAKRGFFNFDDDIAQLNNVGTGIAD
jgi:hypothetical protein|nr:hypothetical protein [Serratia fonticola]